MLDRDRDVPEIAKYGKSESKPSSTHSKPKTNHPRENFGRSGEVHTLTYWEDKLAALETSLVKEGKLWPEAETMLLNIRRILLDIQHKYSRQIADIERSRDREFSDQFRLLKYWLLDNYKVENLSKAQTESIIPNLQVLDTPFI